MFDETFEELLTAYVEGDASEEQLAKLHKAIEASSELRDRFQREMRLNAMLHETVAEQIELQAIQAPQVELAKASRVELRNDKTPSRGWWILVATLLLVSLSGVYFFQQQGVSSVQPVVGTCMSLSGTSSSLRGETRQEAIPGLALHPGDRVSCDEGAQAMLRLVDGSILAMEPESELTLVSTRPSIQVERGEVMFEVAERKPGDSPFQVQTAQSTVDVVGTVFAVSCSDHTVLEVYEGEVALTRRSDQAKVNLGSQQRTSTEAEDLAVQSLSEPVIDRSVEMITLLPTDDLTSSNKRDQDFRFLKVERDRRIAYLRFEIPAETRIEAAKLRLTQSVDTGSGKLQVHMAEHSDWNERDFPRNDRPRETLLIAERSGVVSRSQVVEFDLEGELEPGPVTLIVSLDQRDENDIWFASSETARPPQLLLTVVSDE
ncbi:MAG: FecR domain-containing protein [Planctomycetota bacterium]